MSELAGIDTQYVEQINAVRRELSGRQAMQRIRALSTERVLAHRSVLGRWAAAMRQAALLSQAHS
ncbi:MAG: hypothetical protein JSS20_12030 [Proteobacteria bacterium]|nr:hypothetical protein [Pseudomonadota bacterium]